MAKQVTSVFDRGRTLMRGWPNTTAAFNVSGFTVHAQQVLGLAGLISQDRTNRLELQAGSLSFRCYIVSGTPLHPGLTQGTNLPEALPGRLTKPSVNAKLVCVICPSAGHKRSGHQNGDKGNEKKGKIHRCTKTWMHFSHQVHYLLLLPWTGEMILYLWLQK